MNNYLKFLRKNKFEIKFHRNFFFEKSSQNRYDYEFESPEEQNISVKTILQKAFKFFLKATAFYFICKWMFFTKFNNLISRDKVDWVTVIPFNSSNSCSSCCV